jgi:thiaminase (transcriptional activator TenA)
MATSRDDAVAEQHHRLSQRLWRDSLPLAYFSLHHKFVAGICGGTLPRKQWLDYVAQDAHYLRHFSSAYAHAMDKLEAQAQLAEEPGVGGGDDDHAQAATATAQRLRAARSEVGTLLSSVLDELRLHGGYAARWGVPKETLERGPCPETEAYTSFLAQVASDPASSPGEVLAAMAPCLRLYAWLGTSLRDGVEAARKAGVMDGSSSSSSSSSSNNPYAEWIETYSGLEYGEMVAVGERLLDQLGDEGGGAAGDYGEFFFGPGICCARKQAAAAILQLSDPIALDLCSRGSSAHSCFSFFSRGRAACLFVGTRRTTARDWERESTTGLSPAA